MCSFIFFFSLDDSRSTGEGWLEVLNRCPRTPMAVYTGYPYYYGKTSFGPGHIPGHTDQPPDGHSDNIHPIRLPRPRSAELRGSSVPESADTGRSNGSPRSRVQIKPEPMEVSFETAQERERQGQSAYTEIMPVHHRRSISDYPLIPESLQASDAARRDGLPLHPGDYQQDRPLIQQKSDGHHEGLSMGYLQPDRPPVLPPTESTPREADHNSFQVDGLYKITTDQSGQALVSRQSANRCPVCNRIFHYYSSFNRHMKLHQGVFTHICEVCRRKFTRKEHFVRHKCHRRPNKPSRMADPHEEPSAGGAREPLVQPPPVNNSEPSPREGSIPPPLIHIPATHRNSFTYDKNGFSDGSPPTGQHTDLHLNYDGERPVALEINTNNKHRRKTSTPMKVESFPPSRESVVEAHSGSSTADPQEAHDSQPINYSGDTPEGYHQASPPEPGKSNSGEFNISRPQSSNSEPSRPSHYVGFDQPTDPYSKYQEGNSRRTSYLGEASSGLGKDEQYPLLKRKVLEAVSGLSRSLSADNYNGDPDVGVDVSHDVPPREGSEEVSSQDDRRANLSVSSGDPGGDAQPTDLSASGTPTEQLSRGPSSPSTSNPDAPSSIISTNAITTTSNSAPGVASFEGQLNETKSHMYDPLSHQHIPTGHLMDSSLARHCADLSLNPNQQSAYARSEPSSPAGGKQQGDINCHSCNKKFLHLSSLNRHMKLHKGIFTHACAVCGRKFTRKEHFVNHKCSRRPRNPTRVMAPEEVESQLGQAQKVEYPPSMNLPKQPSPPSGSSWDLGPPGGPTGGLHPLGPGTGMGPEGSTLGLPSSPTEHQRMWKWKPKW